MIEALLNWAMKNRFLVLAGTLLICTWGVVAMRKIPIDAIPDLSENQVLVFADWAGRSPQEVEDQVTYPLTVSLQGLAGVNDVRAVSMFGFSLITVIFDEKTDNYFARTRVLERLNYASSNLPEGVTARLGPDATGVGWVYQYYLKVEPGAAIDLGRLRALQDYYVRYQLNSVSGVAEVASIGGFVRQYQIEVDSAKMRRLNISMEMLMEAVAKSNLNIGGKTIEENGMEFVVRGRGLIEKEEDLENLVVEQREETPILLRDIATVHVGGDFRRGALDVDGKEVVGGIVVMRQGENAYQVIQEVKKKIEEIQPGLPKGVSIASFYDRSELITRAIDTLKHALAEEIILVTLAHILFLWHFRSILIITLPLPASILISFILMLQFGVTSHIMSLTGIAISIGVLVDAGIVMTENVIRHCEVEEHRKGRRLSPQEVWLTTLEASKQVGRPIFFAMAIIVLAFVPVFVLTGQEGKLFHPLAFAKTFAMIGATLLSVTLVPVLCTLLVRGPFKAEKDNWVMRPLLKIYRPVLDWALVHPRSVLSGAAGLLASALILAFGLPAPVQGWLEQSPLAPVAKTTKGIGSEFMPTLEEGSLLFMPVLLPSTSLSEVQRIMSWQDTVIKQVPEVLSAAGKLGRSDSPTDPAPVEMIETTIMLRPPSEWREGLTKSDIIAELTEKLKAVPGYVPGFLQPIENRILMINTGIRAQVGIKIFGDDLDKIQESAIEVQRLVEGVPGATGVAPSRAGGKPYLEVELDRQAMARYGLTAQDLLNAVEIGLGGKTVGTTIKGRERWPIQVRLQRDEREDLDRISETTIRTSTGAFIPLGQVARIKRVIGPNEIWSENGRLRVFVQANVSGRDLGGFVKELESKLKGISLGDGITYEIAGQYENQIHAEQTLALVVPIVMLVIFFLLVIVFHSAGEAAHVILAVPFALSGGVFLQYLMGFNFSVAVWVGYIALFGTAIQTGVVMVVYLEEAVKRKYDEMKRLLTPGEFLDAIKEGAQLRLRPKVMTVSTVVASLLPILLSNRAGAEVMKPLAAPVVGGMLSSLVHILIVTPVIFAWLHRKRYVSEETHQDTKTPSKREGALSAS